MGIDTDLPLIDEHHLTVNASRETVWAALRRYVDSSLRIGERSPLRWLLAASPPEGFALAGEVPLQRVDLAGRHRFSRYRLVFELSEGPSGATRLSARSYGEFPGLAGRGYRALVIGTGGHVVAVRGMLRSIRRASLA